MSNWGHRLLRNLPTINYTEDSDASSYESSNSPPPATPVEETSDGLGEFRSATDILQAENTLHQAAVRKEGRLVGLS